MEQQLQNGQYPQEVFLKKGSWGAFLLTPIWALGSRLPVIGIILLVVGFLPDILLFGFGRSLPISFLAFGLLRAVIRFIMLVCAIYFGLKGRQIAWKSGKWESFEVFRKRQMLLDNIGFGVFLLGLVAVIVFAFAFPS